MFGSSSPKIKLTSVINGLIGSLLDSQKQSQNQILEHIEKWTTEETNNDNKLKKPLKLFFEKANNKTAVIPYLSLIPFPGLCVDEAEIDFEVFIDSLEKETTKHSNEHSDIFVRYGEPSSKGEISVKIKIKLKQDSSNKLVDYLENISSS